MDFEEFFKKKRIDLVALDKAEPALFSEFKTHFEKMGEKSFDHTKKYWFNKLRHQYHLAPEIKTEKPQIENPLAEQTVTESLLESAATPPAAKPGFVPRFKAANIAKPPAAEAKPEVIPAPPVVENTDTAKSTPETPAVPTSPKPGFTPRFKAANMPKPVVSEDDKEEMSPTAVEENKVEEKPAEGESTPASPAPKLGFTPKFRAGNIPKPADSEEKKEAALTVVDDENAPVEKPAADATPPKPPYKPRFNMKTMPPKGEE